MSDEKFKEMRRRIDEMRAKIVVGDEATLGNDTPTPPPGITLI